MNDIDYQNEIHCFRALLKWAFGDETGASAKSILRMIMNIDGEKDRLPFDADGFGRCLRLSFIIRESHGITPFLAALEKHSPWSGIARHWSELERLWTLADPLTCPDRVAFDALLEQARKEGFTAATPDTSKPGGK